MAGGADRRSPRGIRKAAAPRSPAEVFLQHLSFVDRVLKNGNGHGSLRVDTMRRFSGGWELCLRGRSDCLLFSNFVLDSRRRVATFGINGQPIEQLVVRGTGPPIKESGVGKVKFRTAYRSPLSNALSVVLEVQAGPEPVDLDVYSIQYRGPDEVLATASDAHGPTSLQAYATAYVYVAFREAVPGGVLFVDGCVAYCTHNFEVQVPVRQVGSPRL